MCMVPVSSSVPGEVPYQQTGCPRLPSLAPSPSAAGSGEFRGFEYYDGLVFEVFAEGLGYEVAGGGR